MSVAKTRRPLETARDQNIVILVTYLGLAVGLLPGIMGIIESLAARQWAALTAWTLFFFVFAGLLLRLIFRPSPHNPRPTAVFQPFSALTTQTAWPRPEEVKQVASSIDTEETSLTLITGPSGAGKSTLLRVLLPTALNENHEDILNYIYVDTYPTGNVRIEEAINRCRTGKLNVLVLDQFEQWIAESRKYSITRRAEECQMLKQLLTKSFQEYGPAVILSIRKEWYYDLRFLESLVPAPAGTIDIEGTPVQDHQDVTRRAILGKLTEVVGNEDQAEAILQRLGLSGRLLPVETQIVGAVLERDREEGRAINVEFLDQELGGVGGAIDHYFRTVLDGAPDRRICLKVLCALSVRTRFRRQQDLAEILGRLFENEQQARAAVDYLEDQHLIVKRGVGKYELAHDYLAEYFNLKSGELDPIDRDNILFHIESEEGPNTDVLRVTSASAHRGFRLGRFFAIFVITLMIIRLFDFGIHWTLAGKLQPLLIHTNLFDANYIPLFLADSAWAIYIGLFYDRVFIRLKEGFGGRLFSIFVVVNILFCIVSGMLVPYVAWVALGWGGTVLALKLIQLSMRNDLNVAAKARLRVFGTTTLFNLVFLGGLGGAFMYLSFRTVNNVADGHVWLLTSLFISVVLTYACLALAPVHVSRSAVSQILGLMGRSRSAVLPRPES
jgi:energy-coupling factor transporter ATP-binding protein EcfA2